MNHSLLGVGALLFGTGSYLPAMAQTIRAEAGPNSLPQRARVVYRGTWDATVSTGASRPRDVSLRSLADAALRERGERRVGTVTIEAVIDGDRLRATISGTGGLETSVLTGSVAAGWCRLQDATGEVWEGSCGSGGFAGSIRTAPGARISGRGHFSVQTVQIAEPTVPARYQTPVPNRRIASDGQSRTASAANASQPASPGATRRCTVSPSRMPGPIEHDAACNDIWVQGLTDRNVPAAIRAQAREVGINKAAAMSDDAFDPIVVGFVTPPDGDYPPNLRFVRVMFGRSSVSHIDVGFRGGKAFCARRMSHTSCDELPDPAAQARIARNQQGWSALRSAIVGGLSDPPPISSSRSSDGGYNDPCDHCAPH